GCGGGRDAAGAEEIRLAVEEAAACGGAGGRSPLDGELVVVDVALTDDGPREERVRQHVGRPDVVEVREREDEQEQAANDPATPRARSAATSRATRAPSSAARPRSPPYFRRWMASRSGPAYVPAPRTGSAPASATASQRSRQPRQNQLPGSPQPAQRGARTRS